MEEKKLSENEIMIVDKWLAMTIGTPKCPMCGNSTFDPGQIGILPSSFIDDRTINGVFVVSVACRNCSYILMFSAMHMGLVG